jgi:hypothetical protein
MQRGYTKYNPSEQACSSGRYRTVGGSPGVGIQLPLSVMGFHHSRSHHSSLSHTPYIRVAISMEAPLSDWKQVWVLVPRSAIKIQ